MHEEVLSARCGRCWRLAVLAVWLMALSPLGWGQAATTEETAPKAEAEQSGGIKDQPGKELPHTGSARISYILGYRSKKLGQVNIVWTSDGTTAADETAVGIANSLRDYFTSENFKPDSIIVNHQLAANTILVFRGSDDQKRTVLLVLSGVAASAQPEEKKAPKTLPLTLELSYIEDAAHPDVFRIGKGQF